MARPRVIFLHRKGFARTGSKVMRCDQLRAIAERYLGDRYDFSVRPQRPLRDAADLRQSCEDFRGAIVIMLKGTHTLFGDAGMAALRRHARALCIDYVDTDMALKYSRHADMHISASIAGMRILRRLMAENGTDVPDATVSHLTHHADPRLEALVPPQQERLKTVYLGNPTNTLIPHDIADRVTVLKYSGDLEIATTFRHLAGFNLHYAIRPAAPSEPRRGQTTKPFTKGFVAAAVGANVIASRRSDDAVNYLGADYPFLVDGHESAAIIDALDRAEGLFGTDAWTRALERMAYIRNVTSAASVARDLDVILSRFV